MTIRWAFDVVAIVAVVWWQRARVRRGLRLVMGRARSGLPHPRRNGVVAVLVSTPSMEAQLRWALEARTVLRFTHSWAELDQVIGYTPPLTVFVDPMVDQSGDPEGHLHRFRREHIPVVLYTALLPVVAQWLLACGKLGIRNVIFHRFDDNFDRLNAVVDWSRVPPSDRPPRQAA